MALFPNPYQNMGNMMQPYAANNQTTQPHNNINWVQGVEGAKAYQLAPNSNVLLMDSETNGRFYIKTCDNIGMSTLRYFEYKEVSAAKAPEIDTSAFVTRDELAKTINELKEGLKHEQSVPAAKPATYNPGIR